MKITCSTPDGARREMLLREYFLNAYLIALLRRVGEEMGRHRPSAGPLVEARVRVR